MSEDPPAEYQVFGKPRSAKIWLLKEAECFGDPLEQCPYAGSILRGIALTNCQ
jgi:hypothetical protein